jgi:hypothetical protein
MQTLLKETYLILTTYHKDSLIPKEISKLFLEIEDFLYFSSLMEEKENGLGFYHWQELFHLVKALEKGFFEGKYSCFGRGYGYDFTAPRTTGRTKARRVEYNAPRNFDKSTP